jgi:hypothetical protein
MKRETLPREDAHEAHGDQHRHDHHPELLRHPDRRDHRVEREDQIEHDDLGDHADEGRGLGLRRQLLFVAAHRLLVDLHHALADEEHPSGEQDQIAARHRVDVVALDPSLGHEAQGRPVEERLLQAHHPLDPEQEADAGPEREAEADDASGALLLGRERADQDRQEDDVVDPEHDLHEREREQRKDPVHGRRP